MKRIRFIVEQIEQSRKLIIHDELPYLRMAFVLLDNAAEILMHRKASDELSFNSALRRMRESVKDTVDTKEAKRLQEKIELPSIVNRKRERMINRYFDEKTKFLSEDKSYIKKTAAAVLRSLHRYRNELYHNDKVKEETIRATAVLLFEIVCDLLICLPPSSISTSSLDNYDTPGWRRFFSEYKIDRSSFLDNHAWSRLVKKLRGRISISCDDLREALKTHLLARIQDATENIEFIMRGGLGIKSMKKALKHIQFIESGNIIGLGDRDELLSKFKAKYNMKDFKRWRTRIRKFNNIRDKIELFQAFSEIENEFEQLENQVNNAATEFDKSIQLAIDVARGK